MNKQDNLQPINTNTPRETLVYATGNNVIKIPAPGPMPAQTWLIKQQHAKFVSDMLLQTGNKHYFIPRVLQIDKAKPQVIEQRAYGKPVSAAYFESLPAAEQDIIYNALTHFINDINQIKPVLTQAEALSDKNKHNISLNQIIEKLSKYIDKADLDTVINSNKWFGTASKQDASVVFSHGDMNENNIFYNPETKIVSFIDFAEAKYENINYMFDHNFSKLGWLNLDTLRKKYIKLPRKQPVIIKSNPMVERMRNLLKNFTWAATEFLRNPKSATEIRIKMIKEEIAKIKKLYSDIQKQQTFAKGASVLKAEPANVTPYKDFQR